MSNAALGATAPYGVRVAAHAVQFVRELPGPIDRVWSYLTESDLKATWLYDGEIPREVGGEYRIEWNGEDGEFGGRIVIRTQVYEPPRLLEYAWIEATSAEGPTRDSVVRFELTENGDRVTLTLTHRALPLRSFASVAAGWHAHLDKLGPVLANSGAPDAEERYEVLLPEYEILLARGSFDGATKTIWFTRSLPGPIHRVWSYLTEQDELAAWLTKRGAIPAQVGASFVLHLAGDDDMAEREGAEPKTYGTVRVFDAPHVLEYTWGVKTPDGALLESVVRFELESENDRVALTLIHSGVIEAFASRTLGGWHSLLDGLDARLDGRDPGSFMENFRRTEATYRA